jgi:hypothetical protein
MIPDRCGYAARAPRAPECGPYTQDRPIGRKGAQLDPPSSTLQARPLQNRALDVEASGTATFDMSFVACFELRFDFLFSPGRALSFPCNALGKVELEALSARCRENYLFARELVGREFATPMLRRIFLNGVDVDVAS